MLQASTPEGVNLPDGLHMGRASALVTHWRPKFWELNDAGESVPVQRFLETEQGRFPDPEFYDLISEETTLNVKTTVGIDFTFNQTYGQSGAASGLTYIALSNDTLTETSASTTLSTEITTNGLGRALGTYAHTTGASTCTVANTFTCATAAQSAQKAALFSAASVGTMQHALAFTQRPLQVGDTLAVTFTITLT